VGREGGGRGGVGGGESRRKGGWGGGGGGGKSGVEWEKGGGYDLVRWMSGLIFPNLHGCDPALMFLTPAASIPVLRPHQR